ncbi:MAG: DUF4375 domain-containing protein [Candidatus Zixiibacteriota bacterium]
MIKKISRGSIVAEPNIVWNTFIEILATENIAELAPLQQRARLVFQYDAEVQDGGHLQFFEDSAGGDADSALEALIAFELFEQAEIIKSAAAPRRSKTRTPILTAAEYENQALEGEFEEFDSAYYACESSVTEAFELHLKRHFDEYLEMVE